MELTIDQALQRGIEAHKAGELQKADQLYTAILKAQPNHPDANHNLGVLAVGVGKVKQALTYFETALEANPDTAQFWLSYIDALIKLEKYTEAKARLDQAKNFGIKNDRFDQFQTQLADTDLQSLVSRKPTAEMRSDEPNILDTLKLDQAFKLAKKKAKAGATDEARQIFQDILVKFPKNKRALAELAGLRSGAIRKLSKAQQPRKDQVQSLIDLYNQGQITTVIEQAEMLTKQYPAAYIVWNILGAAATKIGKLEQAILAFQKAIAIKPDYAEAFNNMGNAIRDQGSLEKAIQAYNKAIKLKPNYTEAYCNMGIALKDQDKPNEAIAAFKKAIAINPNYSEAFYNMGVTLHDQRLLEEAIHAYKIALSINPDYIEACNNLGNAFKQIGMLDKAIGAFKAALTIKPDYAEAHNNLGNTMKDQGRLDEAIVAYNMALSIRPNYPEVYNNKGNTLKLKGYFEEAIQAYKKAISIKPVYAEAYYNMGNALKIQGKLEEATWAYNQALHNNPDYVEAYNNLGGTFHEQGALDDAAKAYSAALSIRPDYAEAHNNLGVIFQERGKFDDATRAYKKALSFQPNFSEAHRFLSTLINYTHEYPHIRQVEDLLKDPNISEIDRCNLFYAYAKMQEDIGNFQIAFESYVSGGKLKRELLKYDFKQDQNFFQKIKVTAPQLIRQGAKMDFEKIQLTPIFIIGMPRSGTSIVEQIISSHAEVTGAGELPFISSFGKSLATGENQPNAEALQRFRQKYLKELSKRANGRNFVCDKMPQNFIFTALICTAFPEAKIIHVNRTAEATCWSNFKNYFISDGLGYSYTLEETVNYYVLYSDLMHFWTQKLGNRIYHLCYDELTVNQDLQTHQLVENLGLKWDSNCLSPQNNTRVVKTASNVQVRQPLYRGSSSSWRKYEPFIGDAFINLQARYKFGN